MTAHAAPNATGDPHRADGELPAWLGYGAMVAGGLLLGGGGIIFVNSLLPAMARSLAGAEPKVFWYLSRALGLAAYGLLWLSMALGLLLSSRAAKLWPGGPAAADLHEFTTLAAVSMAVLHSVVLLGDRYMQFTPLTLVVPLLSPYRALWVLLGQLGLYLAVPVVASFYLRRHIGPRLWRTLHYLTFAVFALVMAHGIGAGTDSTASPVLAMYLLATVSLFALTAYRILRALRAPKGLRTNLR